MTVDVTNFKPNQLGKINSKRGEFSLSLSLFFSNLGRYVWSCQPSIFPLFLSNVKPPCEDNSCSCMTQEMHKPKSLALVVFGWLEDINTTNFAPPTLQSVSTHFTDRSTSFCNQNIFKQQFPNCNYVFVRPICLSPTSQLMLRKYLFDKVHINIVAKILEFENVGHSVVARHHLSGVWSSQYGAISLWLLLLLLLWWLKNNLDGRIKYRLDILYHIFFYQGRKSSENKWECS